MRRTDSDQENDPPSLNSNGKRPREDNPLDPVYRKKPLCTDPLVHNGRHFGRTIHAFCNIFVLITNGLFTLIEDEERDDELTAELYKEQQLFKSLLRIVPRLEERLMNASQEELRSIADCLQKGIRTARAADTKSLKLAVVDWLTPHGVPLIPPLSRSSKSERGFNHEATGALLCPTNLNWNDADVKEKLRSRDFVVPGDHWPILLYKDYKYDPENPWDGLLRSRILLTAYKHVFTSPSSVTKEYKATRSGNARIHGMAVVTIPSVAYIATLLRFSLSSSTVFSCTDRVTDSQRFYNSIVEFLEDPEEKEEVHDLIHFWNCQIFPEFVTEKRPISEDTALSRLREKRRLLKERNKAI